jgi:hypothetical protein
MIRSAAVVEVALEVDDGRYRSFQIVFASSSSAGIPGRRGSRTRR